MKATRIRHPQWQGSPQQYQLHARDLIESDREGTVSPWAWVTTTCDSSMCLLVDHMRLHQPIRIAYPAGVCVYCGNPGGTVDHLLPKPSTGLARRGMVPVVPACGNCNSRIGDLPSPNIAVRRRAAQLSIRRGYRNLLDHANDPDLSEMSHLLREAARRRQERREAVALRLTWPDDPFYDLRSFQKSGIEDPVLIGLCNEYADPLVQIEEMGNQ